MHLWSTNELNEQYGQSLREGYSAFFLSICKIIVYIYIIASHVYYYYNYYNYNYYNYDL